jgi:RNase H-like domain found in reverse transcriptase
VFDALKDKVTSELVLAQPNLEQPFKVEVDASRFGLGAVLMQRGPDKKKHPVAYYSSMLTEAKQNYNIYDLELLVIVKVLRHW